MPYIKPEFKFDIGEKVFFVHYQVFEDKVFSNCFSAKIKERNILTGEETKTGGFRRKKPFYKIFVKSLGEVYCSQSVLMRNIRNLNFEVAQC